jgi:exopolysaccharide biosynthesis protein
MLSLCTVALLFLLNSGVSFAAAPSSVVSAKKTVATSAGKRTVNLVYINLNDKTLEVKPLLAKDKIGSTESLDSMAKRAGAYAAINGTFFNAYDKGSYKTAHGEIVINYEQKNEGWTGASICFDEENTPTIYSSRSLPRNGEYKHVTSAGPTLLKDGKIVVNPLAEGMKDPKITKLSGQRSFIGYTKDKKLVMGTVPNVTVGQLAEVCKALGLDGAMNMDGGASSGLYYNGKYLTKPGRALSNALIVVTKK